MRLLLFLAFLMPGFAPVLFGQNKVWGIRLIAIPENWSSTQKAGSTVYSNYNLKSEPPAQLALFAPFTFEGKPDTLLPRLWMQYNPDWPAGVPVPRPRRLYTDEGEIFWQAQGEAKTEKGTLFRQVTLFCTEKSAQVAVLQLESLAAYKLAQVFWQEKWAAVVTLKAGKK
ncbi:MAG: hypothetical protein MUF24_03530 [Chitinophagaceae bacterium]|jgi:hypothetical protein|nr:hypothetical protein [Chitinophagaceae bacterium]